MPEVSVKDILVGYGDLYYAERPAGAAATVPAFGSETDSLKEAFDDDANWTYAGATQEGVEIGYAPDYGSVEVDQLGDAAVMFFNTAQMTLNTQLAEATLGNLLVAWGFDSTALVSSGHVDTFSIGIPGQDPIERSVAVVGKGAWTDDVTDGPSTRERVFVGWRALSIEGSSIAMRRAENTAYQVSFRLLADPEKAPEEYGYVVDRIPGAATP